MKLTALRLPSPIRTKLPPKPLLTNKKPTYGVLSLVGFLVRLPCFQSIVPRFRGEWWVLLLYSIHLILALPAGFKPATYFLGGSRSIR